MSATATLRDALLETLVATQSFDANIRSSAEQQIKIFEVTDDYGSLLTEIALTRVIDWSLRQLAAVLLKQYIIVHWKRDYDKFEEPEVNAENKIRIRAALLSSLGEDCDLTNNAPEKKLKSLISFVVYTIGHYDWPEEWSELMPALINYVSSNSHSAVYCSMKVFVEMCHELTESQVPSMIPLLMPKMLQIIRDPNNYGVRTRGRAVQVFTFMVESIAVLKELDKNSVKNLLDPMLPHFMESLIQVLQDVKGPGSETVDIALKKDVVNCLTELCKSFRPRLIKWMPSLLPVVWNSLTITATLYVNSMVNSDSDFDSGDSIVDSDGESISLDAYIFSLFDFVTVLIEHHKTRKLIKQGMTDLIYYLIIYMQITDEQIQVWSTDPDRFVQDEDDDSYSFSVRISAQDVLLSLGQEIEENENDENLKAFHRSFVDALKRHFSQSNQLRMTASSGIVSNNNNSDGNWWKIQEACLFALGSMSESFVVVAQENDSTASDLKSVLDNVFMGSLDGSPFFVGRCLWTAARFTSIMTPVIIDRFLQMTASSFCNPSSIIKISVTRAVYSFASHLTDMGQKSLMSPYLTNILDGLLATGVEFSSDVLSLVLETMCIVCTIDADFTGNNESKIAPLAIATFLRNSADPVLISCCQNIFKELSKNGKCVTALQSRLGPTLNSILNPQQENRDNETRKCLEPAALDILTSMVRSSPIPLSDILMQLFSASVSCILRTWEENATLQNGGECIRAYVSRSTQQVMCFRDPSDGRDGASMVIQVILHLLDPRVSESCSAFVGKLVSTSVVKAGHSLGSDNIHLLLRSVLSKLQTSETLSVIQSLILVFAHLIHHDMKTVLDFLSSIPSPTGGKSALEFVLCLWLSRQHMFFGGYDRKVSLISLGKLLEHSVQLMTTGSGGDASLNLNLMMVPGDPIFSSEKIVTRSQSKNVSEWTQVPCSVKILKVLIAEIGSMQETTDESSSEEDEDEEGSEEHNLSANLCREVKDGYEDESEEDDSDIEEEEANDPVSKIHLNVFLMNFMTSFKKTSVFSQFVEQLNEVEKECLARIN